MKPFLSITLTTLKMLFRNKQSLFFTWFLPLCLMLIIGYVTRSNDVSIRLGVVYDHANTSAQTIVDAMSTVDALEVTTDSKELETAALQDNKRDLVIELPNDALNEIKVYENPQPAIGHWENDCAQFPIFSRSTEIFRNASLLISSSGHISDHYATRMLVRFASGAKKGF